jgi:hypothetical protein
MEKRLGHDFSNVRVHADERAADSAATVDARAYTIGNDIVFNRGQYAPGTPFGDRVLAHELVHVVQNGNGASTPGSLRPISAPADPAELEANRAASLVTDGAAVSISQRSNAQVHRDIGDVAKNVGIVALVTGGLVGAGFGIAALAGAFKEKKPQAEEKPKAPDSAGTKTKPEPERPLLTFDDAMDEGAEVLKPGFGVACGRARGADPDDGYDSTEWKEDPDRGLVIIATTSSSWVAMDHMVKNLGKDVPKFGGGTTKWHFDCFEAVEVLRLYAYYRSMTPADFDKKFPKLEIGFEANLAREWKKPFKADRPKQKPYTEGEQRAVQRGGVTVFEVPKIPSGKSWTQLLAEAPKGSQVIFTNQDAAKKCGSATEERRAELGFCAFVNENTTKLGPDKYWAHPFGVKNEAEIKKMMAEAVVGTATPQYIDKNIYISAIRYPREEPLQA